MIEQNFTFEKETKNTYRYQVELEGKPPAITTLYIMKWALGTKPPVRIKVTVTPQSELDVRTITA